MKHSKGEIRVENFCLDYPGRNGATRAVSNVCLHVRPGEFVSVVGPSGCGKSTFLNAIAGFLKPSSGAVLVDGEQIQGPGADRGMVFQQYSLFPWQTVRKNVEFGMRFLNISRPRRRAVARALLDLAGLLPFENHYPDRLSGGMKQRVGILRALATRPRVLLLDEPFGALDAQTRTIMQQMLTDMWQELNISVLFVTHDIDEAVFLSDRIYVMTARPGTVKAEIEVALPRPRTAETLLSEDFLGLRGRLMALIRQESLQAMAAERDPQIPSHGLQLGNSIAEVLATY